MSKRGFGTVRQLASKRWQARYWGLDGERYSAPMTFDTKKAAQQWLSAMEVQLLQGDWINPERGKVALADYVERWIAQRPGLRPRTRELYRWLLGKHIKPTKLGRAELGKLTTAAVRDWRSELLAAGVSEIVAAKAYRLVRGALRTAVEEDRILPRNPCRVRGADRENSPERPVLTVAQVFAVVDRMPERFRVLVLLTAFCSLRWGEVTALVRADIAEDASTVSVNKAINPGPGGKGLEVGPVKSRAGKRTLSVPDAIRPDVLSHLEKYVGRASTAYVFTGELGMPVRRSNFQQRVGWVGLMKELGMAGAHFHDLRHAGNTWASNSGASTKDLMARMGHDDMRAALIYQHATREADHRMASDLSRLAEAHRKGAF